jgi:hypothetical protein
MRSELGDVSNPRILSPVPALLGARGGQEGEHLWPGVGPGRRVGRGHPPKRIRGAVDRLADLGGCRGAGDTDAGVAGARVAQVGDRVGERAAAARRSTNSPRRVAGHMASASPETSRIGPAARSTGISAARTASASWRVRSNSGRRVIGPAVRNPGGGVASPPR